MTAPQPIVLSVNISAGGIPKLPIAVGEVTVEGLVGDAHDHDKHNTRLQAISILDVEDLEDLRNEGYDVHAGATGENLTVQHLAADDLQIGDRLHFSGGLEIEITKMRNPCYVLDAINPQLKETIRGRCGCYGKVIAAAPIRAGETIAVLPTTTTINTTNPTTAAADG